MYKVLIREDFVMYFRQPRYYDEFKCVGGTCPNSCCVGWSIFWNKSEIDKVINAENCSEELKELMKSSFHVVKEIDDPVYAVTLKENRRCPFLTDDNFCRIQRELGAEYLSNVCSTYPRGHFVTDNACYNYCYMSCPIVMHKLLNEDRSADLVNVQVKVRTTLKNAFKFTESSIEGHPEAKYFAEITELFYDIISDRKNLLETNVILGALAAKALTKCVENKAYDDIPNAISEIRKQLHNGAELRSIENIKPNYSLKVLTIGKFLSFFVQNNLLSFISDKNGNVSIDLYHKGEQRLAEVYKDKEFWLRNVALNLLLELKVPLVPTERTIFENYALYATALAMMKYIAVAAATLTSKYSGENVIKETDKFITTASAIVVRNFSHSPNKVDKLLEMIKQGNFMSPAHLALFIK